MLVFLYHRKTAFNKRRDEILGVHRRVASQPDFSGSRSSKSQAPKMKVLVIGLLIGQVLGVMLTVIYFSLATFFAVESKRSAKPKSPEDPIKRGEDTADPQKMKARAGE
jgi:hypothetical protein